MSNDNMGCGASSNKQQQAQVAEKVKEQAKEQQAQQAKKEAGNEGGGGGGAPKDTAPKNTNDKPVAEKGEPAKAEAKPEPVKEEAKPEPVKEEAKPEPVKEEAKPEPVKEEAQAGASSEDATKEEVKPAEEKEEVKEEGGEKDAEAKEEEAVEEVPAPPQLDELQYPATHEAGKPFIRLVVPEAIFTHMISIAGEKGVSVIALNDAAGQSSRCVDVSADDKAAIHTFLEPIYELMIEEEKRERIREKQRAAEIEVLEEKKLQDAANAPPQAEETEENKKLKREAGMNEADVNNPAVGVKAPKVDIPKSEMNIKNEIGFNNSYKGNVNLTFEWDMEKTAFGEWYDEKGQNWKPDTVLKNARGEPKDIKIQYRRGNKDPWQEIACKDGKVVLEYAPERIVDEKATKEAKKKDGSAGDVLKTVNPKDFRGFQSRWIVDGRVMLSPIEMAPSLKYQLLKYPVVASALAKLPKEQREIHNLPEPKFTKLKKALLAVENMIPMNTWDVQMQINDTPGVFIDGKHAMSTTERMSFLAQEKTKDPKIQSEIRRSMLKAPIQVTTGLLGAVGIPIGSLVPDLDFFLPKHNEPDFEELKAIESDPIEAEVLRRDLQREVSQAHPEWLSGLRIVLPPVDDLERAVKSKRPVIDESTTIDVDFNFSFKDDKEAGEERQVKLVYWKAEDEEAKEAITVPLEAKPETKSASMFKKEEITLFKEYIASGVTLGKGQYRYKYMVNDKPFFKGGIPIEKDTPNSYCTFDVDTTVVFGIGVIV